ncbi:Lytic transglycosylase catalytic [Burkholderia sp. MR1]|nr:Lytic transglycosylase catalytic [Burkholderia sp. MR1]
MSDYSDVFEVAGRQYNVDPKLLKAMMTQESSGNPNAVSPKGATGLMQLMPDTAKEMGVNDPKDPLQNIIGGAKYMGRLLDKYGDVNTALAAYNAGPGAVDKAGGIPNFPETQAYVQRISANYQGKPMAQSTLPGLPPTADSASAGSDPFSKLMGSSTPAAAPSAPAADGDPFSKLMASKPAAQSTQPAQAQPQPSGDTPQGQWHAPGAVTMGIGDVIKGGVQSMVHGGAWLANKIAPDSQFTKDINAAVPQVDEAITSQDAQYAQQRAAQGGSGVDLGRTAGRIIGSVPMQAMPSGAGSGLLMKAGAGALSGLASAAATPVVNAGDNYAQQKAIQLGTGAAVGAVVNPLVSAIGSAVSPKIGEAQKKLLDAGVPLTPGQIKGGNWAKVEDMATSLPGVGNVVRNAQQRALQGYNNATYDQVLQPLGVKFADVANGAKTGGEGVAAVKKTISDAYDNTLSQMTFKPDGQFQQGLQSLASMTQSLPATEQKQFIDTLQRQVAGKINPQTMSMDGATLKEVQGELGQLARSWSSDPSVDKRNLGAAVGEVKSLIEQSLGRNNSPQLTEALNNANAAYANYARLRGAAASSGAMNNDGVFTAAQLQSAVRNQDKSVGKGATATGNALMQDWSSAGQSVLGNKYPDSGTAGRSMLGYLLGGGAFAAPHAILPTVAAAGAAAIPYTQAGGKLAAALLTQRPAVAVPIGNALTRYGVPLAAPAGNALVNAITGP